MRIKTIGYGRMGIRLNIEIGNRVKNWEFKKNLQAFQQMIQLKNAQFLMLLRDFGSIPIVILANVIFVKCF